MHEILAFTSRYDIAKFRHRRSREIECNFEENDCENDRYTYLRIL